ncbi:30S ribosomal protein S6 [Candidatus Atribacteria bacterium MT.SAG.1]|nr:30S ribosomal protein S6 [Candidatus Atribacteria bacterium MT.SAG.1]
MKLMLHLYLRFHFVKARSMKLYELTYLVSSGLTPEQMETLVKKINSLILRNGEITGSVVSVKKNLTYPIKKQNIAFLNQIEFNFEPKEIDKLKEEINKQNEILRIMLTEKKNIKIKKKARSAMLRPKPSLEDTKISSKKELKETKQKIDLEEIGEKLDEILK